MNLELKDGSNYNVVVDDGCFKLSVGDGKPIWVSPEMVGWMADGLFMLQPGRPHPPTPEEDARYEELMREQKTELKEGG